MEQIIDMKTGEVLTSVGAMMFIDSNGKVWNQLSDMVIIDPDTGEAHQFMEA